MTALIIALVAVLGAFALFSLGRYIARSGFEPGYHSA